MTFSIRWPAACLVALALPGCAMFGGGKPAPKLLQLDQTPLSVTIPAQGWASNPHVISSSPTLVYTATAGKNPSAATLKIARISDERRRENLVDYTDGATRPAPVNVDIAGHPAIEWVSQRELHRDKSGGGSSTVNTTQHKFVLRNEGADYECTLTANPDRYAKLKKSFRAICLSMRLSGAEPKKPAPPETSDDDAEGSRSPDGEAPSE